MHLKVKILPHGEDIPFPAYATPGAAGFDLVAAVDRPVKLGSCERVLIPTGLVFSIPGGHEIQIRPRSGLALKNGITVLNAPGTIDSDYRGEVQVMLVNHSMYDFTITRGMRIAQAVLAPVSRAEMVIVSEVESTERGDGGFGSTGI